MIIFHSDFKHDQCTFFPYSRLVFHYKIVIAKLS